MQNDSFGLNRSNLLHDLILARGAAEQALLSRVVAFQRGEQSETGFAAWDETTVRFRRGV